jgi:hypothetical protein
MRAAIVALLNAKPDFELVGEAENFGQTLKLTNALTISPWNGRHGGVVPTS